MRRPRSFRLVWPLLTLVLLVSSSAVPVDPDGFADVCLSETEWRLYEEINRYREQVGLRPLALSSALSRVAQFHARDLAVFHPDTDECNLHSWSGNGDWTPCCYTEDHAMASCMWDKPREITGYPASGFEIAFWSSSGSEDPGFIASVLDGWKNSPGHHQVLTNRGRWESWKWNALGIGVSGGYACVWFGAASDEAGAPPRCLP